MDSEAQRRHYIQTRTMLTQWKKTAEYSYMNEVSCVPLQQALRHFDGVLQLLQADRRLSEIQSQIPRRKRRIHSKRVQMGRQTQ